MPHWIKDLIQNAQKIYKNINIFPLKQKQHSADYNYRLDSACLTDVGGRTNNEDSVKILFTSSSATYLAVVADGMGGHAKGEIASQIAVDTFCMNYINNTKNQSRDIARALRISMFESNAIVFQHAQNHVKYRGMGTTLCSLVIDHGACAFTWVGDSRLYHMYGNQLTQLTSDDTVVNKMVEQGILTPEQAQRHQDAHILTQAVGTHAEIQEIHTKHFYRSCRPGDVFLLTSDGVHGVLSTVQIKQALQADKSLSACHQLIEQAKQANSMDNLSAIVIKILPNTPFVIQSTITHH